MYGLFVNCCLVRSFSNTEEAYKVFREYVERHTKNSIDLVWLPTAEIVASTQEG